MSSHIKLTRWNPKDAGTSGTWGPVTSSIDWCEGNYPTHLLPMAEPVNTLTNFFFLWLSWFGFQKAREQRLSADTAWLYIGCASVALGSTAFHATLRYEWQLADELPMVYASTALCYTVLTAGSNPRGLLPLLIAYDVLVTLIYLYWPNPVFHQVSYGLTVATLVIRQGYLLFTRLLSTPEESKVNAQIRKTAYIGAALYALGFALWVSENLNCVRLTSTKEQVGYPYRIGLELHGWWHILTGLGSYIGAVAATMLSHCLGPEGHEAFQIRTQYGLPYVARVSKASSRKKK